MRFVGIIKTRYFEIISIMVIGISSGALKGIVLCIPALDNRRYSSASSANHSSVDVCWNRSRDVGAR